MRRAPVDFGTRQIRLPTVVIPSRVGSGLISTVCTYRGKIVHVVPAVPSAIRASSGLTVISVNNNGTRVGVLTHDSHSSVGSCLGATLRDYFSVTNVRMAHSNNCSN